MYWYSLIVLRQVSPFHFANLRAKRTLQAGTTGHHIASHTGTHVGPTTLRVADKGGALNRLGACFG